MSNQNNEVTDCRTTQNEKRENHLQGKFRKNWYNILYSYLHTPRRNYAEYHHMSGLHEVAQFSKTQIHLSSVVLIK